MNYSNLSVLRRRYPLGYWPQTGHNIRRYGFWYTVWQRKRFVGKRRSYLGALKLLQESGGR